MKSPKNPCSNSISMFFRHGILVITVITVRLRQQHRIQLRQLARRLGGFAFRLVKE